MGVNCRYDGSSMRLKELEQLSKKHHLIPICPEQLGGLETPREAAEILNGKVVTKSGTDVTHAFVKGAKEVLSLALFYDCSIVILKERSPSCGNREVYDGSFRSQLVKGEGFTAALLKQNNIRVLGESEISKLV